MQLSTPLMALFLTFISISGYAQSSIDSLEISSILTAEEMREIAKKSDKGLDILTEIIDAIDLSFLKEIDPSIKDADIPLSDEEKEQIKAKLAKGVNSIQNIDFEKLEAFLKSLEDAIEIIDIEELKEKTPK